MKQSCGTDIDRSAIIFIKAQCLDYDPIRMTRPPDSNIVFQKYIVLKSTLIDLGTEKCNKDPKVGTFAEAVIYSLTHDLETLMHSGHYHYPCVCHIWKQSVQCVFSYRVHSIYMAVGGGRFRHETIPDSKVHAAYMGPTWGRQDPGGPHAGPMILAICDYFRRSLTYYVYNNKADSRFAPSQCQTALLCNDVSHWLGKA